MLIMIKYAYVLVVMRRWLSIFMASISIRLGFNRLFCPHFVRVISICVLIWEGAPLHLLLLRVWHWLGPGHGVRILWHAAEGSLTSSRVHASATSILALSQLILHNDHLFGELLIFLLKEFHLLDKLFHNLVCAHIATRRVRTDRRPPLLLQWLLKW